MIIKYATGSYSTVLPSTPSDDTSVVYTISNTTPPRSQLLFPLIPSGIADKQRDARVQSDTIRRANLGALITTTKVNMPETIVTGNSLFYTGQVLDFSDEDIADITPINSGIETQHDTYYVDPYSVGLDTDDLNDVEANAIAAQKIILGEIETLQKQKDSLDTEIVSQKKIINEANRITNGIDAILVTDPTNIEMQQIKAKMEVQTSLAEERITIITAQLNALPALIRDKQGQLRALAPLIN